LVLDPGFLQAVNVNILPDTDNLRDLGSSTLRWKDFYLAGLAELSRSVSGFAIRIGDTQACQRDSTSLAAFSWRLHFSAKNGYTNVSGRK